jgi:hypothetical protein
MQAHITRATVVSIATFGLALAALAVRSAPTVNVEALAARVQVLEDREEIRALILAYGQAHAHRD